MDNLKKIQELVICSIVNSHMLLSDKINCLSYLFWNLCWDFDIDSIVHDLIFHEG